TDRYPRAACAPDQMIYARARVNVVSAGGSGAHLRLVAMYYEAEGSVDPGHFVYAAQPARWLPGQDFEYGTPFDIEAWGCVIPGDPDDPLYVRDIGYMDLRVELGTNFTGSEFWVTDVGLAVGVQNYPLFRYPGDGLTP